MTKGMHDVQSSLRVRRWRFFRREKASRHTTLRVGCLILLAFTEKLRIDRVFYHSTIKALRRLSNDGNILFFLHRFILRLVLSSVRRRETRLGPARDEHPPHGAATLRSPTRREATNARLWATIFKRSMLRQCFLHRHDKTREAFGT
jgi:hypothetical protein